MTLISVMALPNSEMVRLSCPYDPDVVSTIKGASSSLRSYDPQTKAWSVHQSIAEQVLDGLLSRGHQIRGEATPEVRPPTVEAFFAPAANAPAADAVEVGKDSERAYVKAKAEEILASIPEHLRHRVFRAMARQMYPDLYDRGAK